MGYAICINDCVSRKSSIETHRAIIMTRSMCNKIICFVDLHRHLRTVHRGRAPLFECPLIPFMLVRNLQRNLW